VDWSKIRALGWQPRRTFEEALAETIEWYREHEWWWQEIKKKQKAFTEYYKAQYATRVSL